MVGLRRRHVIASSSPGASQSLSATATINPEDHANRALLLTGDGSTAQTYTLPLATGSGNKYTFYVQTVNTGTYAINAAGSDLYIGTAQGTDGNDATGTSYVAVAGDSRTVYTIGTVTQGEVGSWVEFLDVASAVWSTRGFLAMSDNTPVTPFT